MGILMYPLRTLLQLKERKKENAWQAYLKAQQQERQELLLQNKLEKELHILTQDYEEKRFSYLHTAQQKPTFISDLQKQTNYLRKLQTEIAQQEWRLKQQQEKVEIANQHSLRMQHKLLVASQEHEILVKHQEKWHYTRRVKETQLQDNISDEIGQSVFHLKHHH